MTDSAARRHVCRACNVVSNPRPSQTVTAVTRHVTSRFYIKRDERDGAPTPNRHEPSREFGGKRDGRVTVWRQGSYCSQTVDWQFFSCLILVWSIELAREFKKEHGLPAVRLGLIRSGVLA